MSKSYPSIIYKYRNWTDEFHKDVLLKNHLFLASPRDFNDPFDCRIPENFSLLDTAEKKLSFSNAIVRRHLDDLIRDGYKPEDEVEKFERRLNEDLAGIQNQNDSSLFDLQDKHLGVLALSARWDSILMWSHYSNFHKGVCYGFHEEKIRNSGLFYRGGPVVYGQFPEISPLEEDIMVKSFIQTHNKAKDWEYEEEYRLIRQFFPHIPTNEERIVTFPNELLAEVIIGISTPESDKNEIIKIAKEQKVKIFQAFKVPFEFKIDRREI